MTTQVTTDLIADDAVTAEKIADAAVGSDQLASGSVTSDKVASGVIAPYSAVRQTVHGGPTTSGLPSFLPASSVSLVLQTQNISSTDPLVVSASQGFGQSSERLGTSTSNLSWTLMTATGVNYLYVDVAANGTLTTGQTTTAPVYSWTASSGTNTFNMTTFTMYTTGTTKGWRVFIGEATAGVSSISAVIAYAYNGRFSSYGSATTPLPTAAQTYTHNIGITPGLFFIKLECTSADGVFAVGETVIGATTYSSTSYQKLALVVNKKTARWMEGDYGGTFYYVVNPASGAIYTLAAASWKVWIECGRGW